jgi:hypothetical protein
MFRWRDYVCHSAYIGTGTGVDDGDYDIADSAHGGGDDDEDDDWKLKFNFAKLQQNNFKPASN